MRDASVVFAYADRDYAAELTLSLSRHGLRTGRIPLWPGQPLLPVVEHGLREARHAVVVVSRHFLKLSCGGPSLDELAGHDQVISVLHGIDEGQVAPHSRRLAVAAIPGGLADGLVRLLEPPDSSCGTNGRSPHP